MQRGVEERADIQRALDAIAHVEEPPALGAGHVFPRETLEGRQSEQGLVDDADRLARQQRAVGRRARQPVVQLAERAPEVARGAMAKNHRELLQLVRQVAQAADAGPLENRREQFRFERLEVMAKFGTLLHAGNLSLGLQSRKNRR